MPDPLSPIQSGVILRRIDPEHTMARYYGLMIERDLFGTVRLVRHCSRIGAIQRRERFKVRCARPLPLERVFGTLRVR